MPARKLTLTAVNTRLKTSAIGVSLLQRGKRLYLQATLPPKPGSKGTAPVQQQIALGIYANPDGLAEAETQAKALGVLLATNTFDWLRYGQGVGSTCEAWIERYRLHLYENKLTGDKDYRWRVDYWNPALKWLPMSQPLNSDAIIKAAQKHKPNSSTRAKACQILGWFIKWCGLEVDLKPYQGSYSSRKPITERNIPDDSLVEEELGKLEIPHWRWVYGMMAAYGLRNHECWHIIDRYREDDVLVVVVGSDTKTGGREVRPLHPYWPDQWELEKGEPPKIKAQSNRVYGERTAIRFRRRGICFTPYSLRHAYAIRGSTLKYQIPLTIMAQMMGHAPEEHLRSYHRWLSAQQSREAYLRAIRPK